jgi:hypothetical protein
LSALGSDKKISVLGVLWWVLFGIALMLKLHYYVAYRKHKKMAEELTGNSL